MKQKSNHFGFKKAKSFSLIFCASLLVFSACKKFMKIDPPVTAITGSDVYNENSTAASVLTGIYSNLSANQQGMAGGYYSISQLQGLAADELINYGPYDFLSQFYKNALNSNVNSYTYWTEIYNQIHATNAALDGINNSTSLTASVKNQLIGEAKFMRAFLHFYAVNLYGDVPLVTTSDYLLNNSLSRTPVAQVYQQIVRDLKEAQGLLSSNFVDPMGNSTMEKIRPNKTAATALLARVYLFTGDFKNAAIQAAAVITTPGLNLVNDLNQVFLANSNEAIWQLRPNTPGYNTFDGPSLVLTSAPNTGQVFVSVSQYLLNSFEPNDQRLANWIGVYNDPSTNKNYYYPFKYKIFTTNANQPTEYTMVLRLAEQFLILAEAEANGAGNGLSAAIADLNTIRTRAGLPPTTASTQTDVLNAIQHERQVELFTEWGHRWFDLKRTNTLNSVMGSPGNVCAAKGGTWNSNWQLLPIPQADILTDVNLKQNPGYE